MAIRFENILCPVDRSEISHLALEHARQWARWFRAPLTVIEVAWPGMPPIAIPTIAAAEAGWPLLTPEERREFEQALRTFCGEIPDDVVERHEVVEGEIVAAILRRIASSAVNLVVLGTHGRSGFQHAMLGSVTEKIVRKANCPVLVVPPRLAEHARKASLPYRTILCATDFSAASSKALDCAVSLAQESEARLILQHVTQWPTPQQLASDTSLGVAALAKSVREAAAAKLHGLVKDDVRAWCDVRSIVSSGKPHEEIINAAIGERADLIVLGVHSRLPMLTPFFGSTANQVLRHSRCPVLIVRP